MAIARWLRTLVRVWASDVGPPASSVWTVDRRPQRRRPHVSMTVVESMSGQPPIRPICRPVDDGVGRDNFRLNYQVSPMMRFLSEPGGSLQATPPGPHVHAQTTSVAAQLVTPWRAPPPSVVQYERLS